MGSNGNIGKKISYALSDLGSDLILVDNKDINSSDFRKLNKNCKINFYNTDLSIEKDRLNLCRLIKKKYIKIDNFINCAGLTGEKQLSGWNTSFNKQSTSAWRKCIEINLISVFDICKQISPLLIKSNNASIINISSIYSKNAPDKDLYKNNDIFNPAAYGASKAGLDNLTKYLAVELSPKVRSNSIVLGGIKRKQNKLFINKYSKKTLLNRMGTEEDVCNLVVFLCSEMSSYITGQNISLDGGFNIC